MNAAKRNAVSYKKFNDSIDKSKKILIQRKSSKPSRGEKKIIDFLVSNCIKFSREWFMKGLYSSKGRLLYFDFFLPGFNLAIEFDGAQHYSKNKSESATINDFKKNAFCLKNGINFLRVKYSDINKVEEIICKKCDSITI